MTIPVKMLLTDETKWVSWGPARVMRIFGYNNNAGDDRYIQFHAKPAAALVNGDVPYMAGLFAPASAPIAWQFQGYGPLWLPELTIAISSTEVNYTAVTNTGLDITVLVDTEFPVNAGTTIVGDLTTNTGVLTVWSDASGPKKLFRVDIKNNSGATGYGFVSGDVGDDEIGDPQKGPLKVFNTLTGGFSFGRNGLSPKRVTLQGLLTQGCEIMVSDSPLMDGLNTPVASGFNIRAIYE